jgi:hypothetical protein
MKWPSLSLDEWLPTYATLHRWVQIVGKTRLALSPFENHWWHCALYVTTHGVGTSPMPLGGWDLASLRSSRDAAHNGQPAPATSAKTMTDR